jgi:hypothetical protein
MIQKSEVRSQKSELRRLKSVIKDVCLLSSVFCLLSSLIGCDAFVRKFTRKPKKEELPQEEMVLAPEEYKGPQITKEELYRQYFLFWKSWMLELIESLLQNKSLKKQVDCAQEALKNLISLKELLNEEAQKKLDVYITQLEDLKTQITKDLYGSDVASNLRRAERIKMNILKDFSYAKIKNFLK